MAGDTELTRMPNGPRKSAIPSVIPRTAAAGSARQPRPSARALTLRGPVCQAAAGHRGGHNRSNIDDAAAFLGHAGTERPVVGVLGIDGVRDARVDGERAVGVDLEDALECLRTSATGLREFMEPTGLPRWDDQRRTTGTRTHGSRLNESVAPLAARRDTRAVDGARQGALGHEAEDGRLANLVQSLDVGDVDRHVEAPVLGSNGLGEPGALVLRDHVEDHDVGPLAQQQTGARPANRTETTSDNEG